MIGHSLVVHHHANMIKCVVAEAEEVVVVELLIKGVAAVTILTFYISGITFFNVSFLI